MNNKKENASAQVPVLVPYVGTVYSFGWEQMKKFFLDLFLITVIVGVVLMPLFMILSLDGRYTPGGVILRMFALAYWLLLFAPIDYGSAFIFLKAVKDEQFEVKDTFMVFEKNYLNVVLTKLMVSAIIAIGVMLLVIPGIIFACKLAFVKFLVMDRKMDPVEAVKESWKMTEGHAGNIFLIGLLAIPIAIAGMLCFAVGVIPAVMWIRCAFASMYYAATKTQDDAAKE